MNVSEEAKQRILKSEMMQFGQMVAVPNPEGKTVRERYPPIVVDWDAWYMSYAEPLAKAVIKEQTVNYFDFCRKRGGREIESRMPDFALRVCDAAIKILKSQGHAVRAHSGYLTVDRRAGQGAMEIET